MIARSCITHHAKVDVKIENFIRFVWISSDFAWENGNHEKIMVSALVSNGHLRNRLNCLGFPGKRRKRGLSNERCPKVITATNGNGAKNISF